MNYVLNPLPVMLLHDMDEIASLEEIAVMVASGDFFVTMATLVEEMAQDVPANSQAVGRQLDRLADILFYMQRYYKISRKKPDHRGGIY